MERSSGRGDGEKARTCPTPTERESGFCAFSSWWKWCPVCPGCLTQGRESIGSVPPRGLQPCPAPWHGWGAATEWLLVPHPAAQCDQEPLSYLKWVLPLWLQRDLTAGVGRGHLGTLRESCCQWGTSASQQGHPEVTQLEAGLLLLQRPPPCSPGKTPQSGTVTAVILLGLRPVMLSPRHPRGGDRSHAAAQPSWKPNQTTGSKTLINMLCILRIRLLVTLKLNSNAILKYIIRWIYFTSGLS